MPVRLQLLGPPQIEFGGTTSALPFERRHQLFVLLALRRSWVGRAELAALFWPEQDGRLAFANLRKTLFRLQSLPWSVELEVQGSALRLVAETDVAAFDAALLDHRVDDALRLCQGDLLEGFDDGTSAAWSAWLVFERERIRGALRGAAHTRLADETDPADAIALSAWLLDTDPLDEAALQAHMTWLARSGQGARARQAYRDFAARLAQEFGLTPGNDLKALHDALGATVAPPPLPPPTVEDGFVGRATELRQIAALLAQADSRLVSLVGPGGVGKTRLARQALQALAPGYADGAVFVPLDDIGSPPDLAARLARELEIRLTGGAEPLAQVAEFLRERSMLLVLDSAEQLAGDAASFEALLGACPRLKILLTSRVRLAAASGWLVAVAGLPCPEAEDADRIEAFDAVRLFVQAARRVEPALVPAAEAAAIVDICRQVEGLPLALELAATWTRVLSCEAIAAELRRGTELLHAVDPARPARHASIEVVFDQSWQRLGPAERAALVRLSVFRGGFSAEAARAVGASLPVLGALADKSLLRKEGLRLFMHPLVQQLAALRLAAGEAHDAERAHASYFLRLLAQSRRAVEGGDRDALQALDIEFENCRSAWRAATAGDEPDVWRRSVLTLLSYCDHRGRFEEGLALLRGAIDAHPAGTAPAAEALLHASAAHLEYRLDRYADAQARAVRALAATGRTRDHDTRLQCFKVLGACDLRLGRNEAARRHYHHALREAQAHLDARNAAAILGNLALVAKGSGRYDEALRLSVESLAQYRGAGDAAGEALCLCNLGSMYGDRGDLVSAETYLRECLAICERHGLVATRAFVLANLTEIAMKAGDPAAAEAHGHRALEVAQTTGNRAVAAWLKMQFARLALQRADLDGARADLATALGLAISLGRPSLQLAGVACFAELLAAQGEGACARRVLAFAAGLPLTSPPERDEFLARLAQWPAAADADPALGLGFDELVRRIVAESRLAHAPLITALRVARPV